MVRVSFTDEVWDIINNKHRISNKDYDFLMNLFSNESKYDFFIVSVEHFREILIDEWNNQGKFLDFSEYVHTYEVNPQRYLFNNNKPRDKANYLAFKIAQYLAFDYIDSV